MSETAALRQLLLEIYVSGSIRDDLPDAAHDQLLTTILAAAEGRPFEPIGLPFPTAPEQTAPSAG